MAARAPQLKNEATMLQLGPVYYSSEGIPQRRVVRDLEPTVPQRDVLKSDAEEENLDRKTSAEEEALHTTESSLAREYPTAEAEVEEGAPMVPSWTRTDRMRAILLRPETLQLIKIIDDNDPVVRKEDLHQFLLASQQTLHTFSDLVSEDLISLKEGRLLLSQLAEHLIEQLTQL